VYSAAQQCWLSHALAAVVAVVAVSVAHESAAVVAVSVDVAIYACVVASGH
jgi:uncharacterized membrane protein YgaE (UPF0421/DUF939 family)